MRNELTCTLLKAAVNHTYLISDGKKRFIFRVYPHLWRTAVEVAEELRLINLLKAKSIRVAQPISDAKGNFVQHFSAPEGPRFGVLFQYAEGGPVLGDPETAHAALGSVQARMHLITHQLRLARPRYDFQMLVEKPVQHLQPFMRVGSETHSAVSDIASALKDAWRGIDTKELRQGTVHLDLWMDNLHVNPAGELTLFDFDFCGNGWLCLDMAYSILQIYFTNPDPVIAARKVEAFLEGYYSVSDITAEELRVIPMLGVAVHLFYLGVQAQRHSDWSSVFFSPHYLDRVVQHRLLPAYQRWRGC